MRENGKIDSIFLIRKQKMEGILSPEKNLSDILK
jgi:hypothetical protein